MINNFNKFGFIKFITMTDVNIAMTDVNIAMTDVNTTPTPIDVNTTPTPTPTPTNVNTTPCPVIPIEELVKPYGINITHIDEIYTFLDLYYDLKVDKSNIKKDFIKYQIDNKFTQVTKVGILIYI